MDRQQSAVDWGFTGLTLGLLLFLTLFLHQETVLNLGRLWAKWEGGGYEHGYLVLLISCYMAYRGRESLVRLTPGPSTIALAAIASCSLVWLAAALTNVQVLQQAVLLPLIVSVIWAIAGDQAARKMLLPVMYISFAVPLWDPLLPVLQEITASAAFTLTRVAGIPAILQDYIVTIPAGQLSIRPTCSGLHYLLAALALGTFYAYLNYRRISARLLVIAAAAGAAILANILRVFIIIYLAYVTDMRHPIIYDHLMLGWYLFGGLVVVLMLIDHLIYRNTGPASQMALKQADKNETLCYQSGNLRRSLVSIAAAGLIAIGPALYWWVENRIPAAVLSDLELPRGVAGWEGPVLVNDSWSPLFHGATELKRGYHKDDSQVLLYVGFYSQQYQGRELINDFNRISNPPAWKPEGPLENMLMTGGQRVIESEMVSVHGQRRIVRYFYRVAGRNTTSKYKAKFLQLLGILTGQTRAGVIAVAGDFRDDAGDARLDIEDFLRAMGPALTRLVDGQVAAQGGHK